LQKEFPDKLILGMEIRDVVANYVASKINSIRVNSGFKECLNVGVVKTNTMKTIHNYFRKGSVRSLYLTKFIVGEDVLLLCRPSLQEVKPSPSHHQHNFAQRLRLLPQNRRKDLCDHRCQGAL